MTALCPNCHGDCCVNKRGSVVDHGSVLALHSCPDCLDGYALDLAVARLDALLDAERENTALRAEVERLGNQRRLDNEDLTRSFDMGWDTATAAVVSWLYRNRYDDTAERIERGEHRREEEE